jgi:hypothetical protein
MQKKTVEKTYSLKGFGSPLLISESIIKMFDAFSGKETIWFSAFNWNILAILIFLG